MWSQKYKPKTLSEVVGNMTLIEKLRSYRWNKPILLYGGTGVGKSVIVETLANDLNWDLVKITEENIDNALSISETSTLFGAKRLILVDMVENMKAGRIFPGKELIELVKKTKNPTVLISNDIRDKKLVTIKRYCEPILVMKPRATTIAKILELICKKEGIEADKGVLLKIAENTGGDVRSAINDLELICAGKEVIEDKDLEVIKPRDKSIDIFNALSKIFGAKIWMMG